MRFETPWAFLLLLALPALWWLIHYRSKGVALRFSSTRHAAAAGRSWRQRLIGLPAALRVLAIVLLVAALARPQQGREHVRDVSEGVAIEMVVDRSGSMQAEMNLGGRRMTRLDAVKEVFSEFIYGNNDELPGRPNDLVGLISFARYADTICPLTLGHGALARFLENVRLVQQRNEDGTAIGDALALAAARLKKAEETLANQDPDRAKDYTINSKIIILLTDGQANAGKRHPLEAAKQAAEWGVKIYTIGIGGGEATTRMQTPFGNFLTSSQSDLDERTLKAIAEESGGIYRRAGDVEALRAVYKEIDELEKSEIESVRYLDYQERFAPFALAALLLIAIEILLRGTLFRKLP